MDTAQFVPKAALKKAAARLVKETLGVGCGEVSSVNKCSVYFFMYIPQIELSN